ncbi:non-ribosomal peptide synthetase [Prauserella cavernicola]|uniref:Amino acid adenylation domain-containing protein n=1 Tax=Prauserella cavernicola TaxID=2800127 RepID=A0A934V2P5_9PSEU|nr:amino acid adenylation domain-containing protein [Prauserella cavernicola]MBK1783312.1 amino acid adenylation domain-containing protein [Prauserella cavernicola]
MSATSLRDTREFWRTVLAAGGTTAVPRWTSAPAPGFAEHEAVLGEELSRSLRSLAAEAGAPVSAALLAAHVRVLAALTGERAVTTGYVTGPGPPLPCSLSTGRDAWRELLARAARTQELLRAHREVALDELRRELELPGPAFETEFAPTETGGELAETTMLRVTVVADGPGLAIRLRYRTTAFDSGCAARIAGYHRTALAQLVADPDTAYAWQSLLSAAEIRYQREELAGPRRALPDFRAHELFEQRVREQPDAVAAVHGGECWTYRQLNARANRLARALLARGLEPEGVVAVVTERDLDWLAGVLAILKAGGAYLPIEPRWPTERVAAALTRAGCELVITEPGVTAALEQALPALPRVTTLLAGEAAPYADDDLELSVGPDRLAYIYFTSGSTGEPKGAMCEHAGLLNHLLAKIDDLGVGEGDAVAQTAPQGFDISLWQLLAPLLVGGRTVLVAQEEILDAARFVDRVVEGEIAVLQVVPSYLEVVLSTLERHPRALPHLRCVSVTGEALKPGLARRWFRICPEITLVNAYGLTETSDDTNHEVMHEAPAGTVPLGRPIRNVGIDLLDDHLSPVPLGAPGEITFSGVCVGRGYVNDPERTRRAFLPDPHRQGLRLYRSGDHGRWRPDGKLEFLGRKDDQVKIRGFRIELGEVENALLRAPGVRDGAVVVAEHQSGSRNLVAFYSAADPVEPAVLRTRLEESLPPYMIPSAAHWRAHLPLTANGKIDRGALTTLAGELGLVEEDHLAPRTPAERRLAAAWADVLGVSASRIGRRDHFFELGGTSLSAVKLAVALDRAVTLADVTAHPVLADQAALLDGRSEQASGVLQRLSDEDGRGGELLVCFPDGGGNAVNFRPLAGALRGSGLAVYAAELPGHDPAAEHALFAPLSDVVDGVVAELRRIRPRRVLLWGHSSGTAFALETARRLWRERIEVGRLFLGAQLLGDAASRKAELAALDARGAADIAAGLSADGYAGLAELDPRRAERVAAAYRHDCAAAHRYFAGLLEDPDPERVPVPVTAVVAADDPVTEGYTESYADWARLAGPVTLRVLADGGHYFARTRPRPTAAAVVRATGPRRGKDNP